MTEQELVKRIARAVCQDALERHGACYDRCEETGQCCGEDIDCDAARAALSALREAIPGLDSLIAGTGVVVPKEPTAEMLRAGLLASTGYSDEIDRAMIEAAKV